MLEIAVISDIHAYSKSHLEEGERRPSFVELSDPSDSRTSTPFAALKALVEEQELTADLLVCGGDLGDKAHPDAISYAWANIKKLQTELKAPELLVATGNHDMDSRFEYNDHDAKSTLQGLPDYPFSDDALNNEYWARNVVVGVGPGYRWVVLNSSAHHGYNDEWKHGRVSKRTREYLERRLQETGPHAINILVTHHHVYKLDGIGLEDYSEMTDASALLGLLTSGGYGRWLIIHGHQHGPAISYANGSKGAPVVFSAGSFSAVLWDERSTLAQNQFYMLQIPDIAQGYPVQGTFRAWDWISDQGFRPAKERSGLPGFGGFGGMLNGSQLADAVQSLYATEGLPFLPFSAVVSSVPDLQFAMPDDYKDFVKDLDTRFGISVLDIQGRPSQIGKA